ncbi:MAG: LysM peptidoglycan-binding domain-containing protein [Anaerolineales bacterium]|nr:LysM peptidoglycan-binding domain-containing protein [Anaerolineales bacterium]
MSNIKKLLMILFITVILVSGSGFAARPAQASGCAYYHVVRAGDTLSGIARWYGAYWPYLAQINGIQAPRYRIYTGQVLCINFGGYGGRYTTYPTYTSPVNYQAVGTGWGFAIASVTQNSSVTIRTNNFPSNVLFKAKMGRRSGSGYEWVDLPDIDSGRGGRFEAAFTIPSQFHGTSQLVVRLIQNKKNGKTFTHDQWFSNVTSSSGTGGRGVNYYPYNYYYHGTIPTIWIVSVVRNSSVTIRTANFPPNTDFQVLMGPMGARGFGYHVTTFNSGAGGAMTLTFSIPPQLFGSQQISIRTQNNWSGYFSYNWFYNNTAY